jgi:hypothetical protein
MIDGVSGEARTKARREGEDMTDGLEHYPVMRESGVPWLHVDLVYGTP